MDTREQVDKLLAETSEEVRAIVQEVLRIETKYVHMTLPRGIHDEIVEMVERVVK